MSRDVAIGSGIFASVWAVLEFGLVHSPELLGVVGPLLRLSQRTPWLPAEPVRQAWLLVTVLVLLFGVWRVTKSAKERFKQ